MSAHSPTPFSACFKSPPLGIGPWDSSSALGPDQQSPGGRLLTGEGRGRRKERVRQRLNHQLDLHRYCFSVLLLPVSVTGLLFPRAPEAVCQRQQLSMRRQELSFLRCVQLNLFSSTQASTFPGSERNKGFIFKWTCLVA